MSKKVLVGIVVLAVAIGLLLANLSTPEPKIEVDVAPPLVSGAREEPVAEPTVAPEPTPVPVPVGLVGVLQAKGQSGWLVQTASGTVNVLVGESPATSQVQIGDKLGIWALETAQGTVAVEITVIPQSPERMHYLGQVSSVTPDRIDIVGQQGETTPFRVDQTLQKLPDGYVPAVGDTVTVVAKPDPLFDGWLAVAVAKR